MFETPVVMAGYTPSSWAKCFTSLERKISLGTNLSLTVFDIPFGDIFSSFIHKTFENYLVNLFTILMSLLFINCHKSHDRCAEELQARLYPQTVSTIDSETNHHELGGGEVGKG